MKKLFHLSIDLIWEVLMFFEKKFPNIFVKKYSIYFFTNENIFHRIKFKFIGGKRRCLYNSHRTLAKPKSIFVATFWYFIVLKMNKKSIKN